MGKLCRSKKTANGGIVERRSKRRGGPETCPAIAQKNGALGKASRVAMGMDGRTTRYEQGGLDRRCDAETAQAETAEA